MRKATRRRFWKVALVSVCALSLLWLWGEIGGLLGASQSTRVVIPKGSSMRAAAMAMRQAGAIQSATLFRLYASTTGRARAIKPGTYAVAPHTSYTALLEALVTGAGIMHSVVIPEGYDLRDIVPLLSTALQVSEDSVRAAVTDTAWRRRLSVPAPSLEGYLFPATYTFADGTTARDAVGEMLARFEAAWRPEWTDRLQQLAISRHVALTMASIVEKEARHPEERPLIAAVYWNRVRKGMLLQADPTVQYALPQHVDRVLLKDLTVTSAYNTYKNPGLPPGPIASPGEASIAAALAPANVPYLFFVARPDGHHVFTTTFAEHSRAIATIRRAGNASRADSLRAPRNAPRK